MPDTWGSSPPWGVPRQPTGDFWPSDRLQGVLNDVFGASHDYLQTVEGRNIVAPMTSGQEVFGDILSDFQFEGANNVDTLGAFRTYRCGASPAQETPNSDAFSSVSGLASSNEQFFTSNYINIVAVQQIQYPQSYEWPIGQRQSTSIYDPSPLPIKATHPLMPRQRFNKGGEIDLYKDLALNEHGLHFKTGKECYDIFENNPVWKPAPEYLPTDDERAPYVVLLRDAIISLPSASTKGTDEAQEAGDTSEQAEHERLLTQAGDGSEGALQMRSEDATQTGNSPANNKACEATLQQAHKSTTKQGARKQAKSANAAGPAGGLGRWGPEATYYEPLAIEIAAQVMMDKLLRLHTIGWTRPPLDPKQRDIDNLYEPELNFHDRLTAVENVLKSNKNMCKFLLDLDDLKMDKLVAGPNKYLKRSAVNKKINVDRQTCLVKGREVVAEEDESQHRDNKKAKKTKRKAVSISGGDETQTAGSELGLGPTRKVKKPRPTKEKAQESSRAEANSTLDDDTHFAQDNTALAAGFPTASSGSHMAFATAPQGPHEDVLSHPYGDSLITSTATGSGMPITTSMTGAKEWDYQGGELDTTGDDHTLGDLGQFLPNTWSDFSFL
ncbi:hypothetical protein BU16DRAFT_537984 [Lophium mytilinum]|uniref:Uncharacterized protein n=1 Tax=Lophium mytilinum TaxID=390894 RepID=A0A6A6QXB2_9PEZI|nr:hypothetical protein BU16DRAFT_537984 [Lophium mytilinum]